MPYPNITPAMQKRIDLQTVRDSRELIRIERREHLAKLKSLQLQVWAVRDQIEAGRAVIDNRMTYFALKRRMRRESELVENCGGRIARCDRAIREIQGR